MANTGKPVLGRSFWWVVGNFRGRCFRLGPFRSESEGDSYGYEKLPCSFDVVETATRDPNAFGRQYKKQQLDRDGDLGSALQRGRRRPPSEYQQGRW